MDGGLSHRKNVVNFLFVAWEGGEKKSCLKSAVSCRMSLYE